MGTQLSGLFARLDTVMTGSTNGATFGPIAVSLNPKNSHPLYGFPHPDLLEIVSNESTTSLAIFDS